MSTVIEQQTTQDTHLETDKQLTRVCHVSLTLCTGGLERLLVDFARFHNREKYAVQFMAMQEVGRFGSEIEACDCTVSVLTETGRVRRIRELARFFREEKITVVHTHNTYPHLYATLAARLAGVPVVINTRHGQRFGHNWKSRIQYRWTSKLVDRMVTVSDDAAALCHETDGVNKEKVVRIWNGINASLFAYKGPADSLTAISVARLSKEKDFPTLLRAMKIVKESLPEFRLKLVGDGAERTMLENLATELELGETVEFLGERKDVPELLPQAGFYISSSLSEGISLTILEAMAVGLPVVATSVGGNPEIVVEGETGHLVPAGNPEALATGILQQVSERERWATMGKRGRERVEEHFEIHRMVQDYENLYTELLTSKQK